MADDSERGGAGSAPNAAAGMTFPAFILSLGHRAAVHFGDVADPVTGRTGTPNLAGAQQVMDILVMLELKTRGNLSAEERQLLEQLLIELHDRFVAAQRARTGIALP